MKLSALSPPLLVALVTGCDPSRPPVVIVADPPRPSTPTPTIERTSSVESRVGPNRALLSPTPNECFDIEGNLPDGLAWSSSCELTRAGCRDTLAHTRQLVGSYKDAVLLGECGTSLVVSCFTYERLSDNRKLWGCSRSIPHCEHMARLRRADQRYGFVSRCEELSAPPRETGWQ